MPGTLRSSIGQEQQSAPTPSPVHRTEAVVDERGGRQPSPRVPSMPRGPENPGRRNRTSRLEIVTRRTRAGIVMPSNSRPPSSPGSSTCRTCPGTTSGERGLLARAGCRQARFVQSGGPLLSFGCWDLRFPETVLAAVSRTC